MFRAAAGEFLVTTMFLFIVCAVGLNLQRSGHKDSESLVSSALSTGFASVALIYSFADVSGAHFNPAVTFATIITKKTSLVKGTIYWISQLSASLFAMLLLVIAFPPDNDSTLTIPQELIVVPGGNGDLFRSFVMEVILTFILVYVIFATAFDTVPTGSTAVKVTDDKGNNNPRSAKNLTIYTTSGNSKSGFAPLAIGLTLGFLCFVGGSVSGGAFNPARVFMAGFTAGNFNGSFESMWLYFAADFIGAGLAGLIHQKVFASHLYVEDPAAQAAKQKVAAIEQPEIVELQAPRQSSAKKVIFDQQMV